MAVEGAVQPRLKLPVELEAGAVNVGCPGTVSTVTTEMVDCGLHPATLQAATRYEYWPDVRPVTPKVLADPLHQVPDSTVQPFLEPIGRGVANDSPGHGVGARDAVGRGRERRANCRDVEGFDGLQRARREFPEVAIPATRPVRNNEPSAALEQLPQRRHATPADLQRLASMAQDRVHVALRVAPQLHQLVPRHQAVAVDAQEALAELLFQ